MISKHKKDLMQILTRIAGDAIKKMESEGYTAKDISTLSGVTQNRITEIKYAERYKIKNKAGRMVPKPISETNLTKLIEGGIVSVDTIISEAKSGITQEQIDYIEQYRIFEDKDLNFLRPKCDQF